jgi:hypothetical protein
VVNASGALRDVVRCHICFLTPISSYFFLAFVVKARSASQPYLGENRAHTLIHTHRSTSPISFFLFPKTSSFDKCFCSLSHALIAFAF